MVTSSIITVATMKGGSGKSTVASCLAAHWHLEGRRPTIIDADPQRSIARLATRERALGGVPVVEDATEDAWKTARRLAAGGGPVIIDTPGFRSETTLACLAMSDFILVPVKPSPFDVDRMLDTLNILINGVSGRRPVFRCLLTQTTRESVIAKHIRAELAEAGFPLLRERDDQPRRLCGGGTLGCDAEPHRHGGAGCAGYRGHRRRSRRHPGHQTGGVSVNKKTLPKAIRPKTDNFPEASAGPGCGRAARGACGPPGGV